jgi:hypothetical protein
MFRNAVPQLQKRRALLRTRIVGGDDHVRVHNNLVSRAQEYFLACIKTLR